MGTARFSIAGLMAVVAASGLTFAALHAETEAWADAALTIGLAASGVAILGCRSSSGRSRSAWAGFLVFGTGYLILSAGPWCRDAIMPHLLATSYIDERYARMTHTPSRVGERVWATVGSEPGAVRGVVYGEVGPESGTFDVMVASGGYRYAPAQLRAASPEGYRLLCHSLIALWSGLLGMIAAGRLAPSGPG